MAATFYNITESEMTEFLSAKGFRKIELPNTVELVYGKRVDQDGNPLSLRVYTGINPNGHSRGVGEDAMRVVLFGKKSDGSIVKLGGSKRVNRVQTWKKNLGNRIDSWLDYLPKDSCAKCGSPMVPRKGRNGDFLGCTSYPECKHTARIEN